MFEYIATGYAREHKQTATIDDLLKLCKAGDVARVIIPNTYYGYGSTLIDTSNIRSIQRSYPRARFTMTEYNLTMSASQFVRSEEYREMIEALAETDPLFNDQDYAELEYETQLEFLVDELKYILDNDETQLEVDWTKDAITEVLESGSWDDRIEWWEYVSIGNDGYTPYATKDDVATLAEMVKARAVKRED